MRKFEEKTGREKENGVEKKMVSENGVRLPRC
jgi:hypothetical protein